MVFNVCGICGLRRLGFVYTTRLCSRTQRKGEGENAVNGAGVGETEHWVSRQNRMHLSKSSKSCNSSTTLIEVNIVDLIVAKMNSSVVFSL